MNLRRANELHLRRAHLAAVAQAQHKDILAESDPVARNVILDAAKSQSNATHDPLSGDHVIVKLDVPGESCPRLGFQRLSVGWSNRAARRARIYQKTVSGAR